jgi:hypothetical protein
VKSGDSIESVWPVLVSTLDETVQSSDVLKNIVGLTGLDVDWSLNDTESYSHGTRKRAFLQNIEKAFKRLMPGEQQRVASRLHAELLRRYPAVKDLLLERLGHDISQSSTSPQASSPTESDPEKTEVSSPMNFHAIPTTPGTLSGNTSKPAPPSSASNRPFKIFLSHSSIDKELANAVLDFLCTALRLHIDDFFCTSVEGANLRAGAYFDAEIREAVVAAPVFLSLLTPKAISSTYVLFELGARWGSKKDHLPLLAKGVNPSDLRKPIDGMIAILLKEETQVLKLVHDLAPILKLTPLSSHAYLEKAKHVASLASAVTPDPHTAPEIQVEPSPEKILQELANTKLLECVEIFKGYPRLETALRAIQRAQGNWDHKKEQVTVIAGDKVVFHADTAQINVYAGTLWITEDESASLFRDMLESSSGSMAVTIKGYPTRLTGLAWQTVNFGDYLIVVEVHKSK